VPWPVEVKGDKLVLGEVHSGTRGSTYLYVLNPESRELVHVGSIELKYECRLLSTSRRGRRKDYEYEVPIDDLLKKYGLKRPSDIREVISIDKRIDVDNVDSVVVIYEFSYSNRGYGPYVSEHAVVKYRNGEVKVYENRVDFAKLLERGIRYRIMLQVKQDVRKYQTYVPNMVNRVKSIENQLGFEIYFANHAARLEEIFIDPRAGLITAQTLPHWQSTQKALRSYIRGVHEVYVATLIAEALKAKTIYHVIEGKKPYWNMAEASDEPTAILETVCGKKITLWYQFSLKKWFNIVRNGMYEFFTEKAKTSSRKARQYIRPDIVVFEGEYREREELSARKPKKVILIDSKVDLTLADVQQLKNYAKNFGRAFGNRVVYIVACLENVQKSFKTLLQGVGYYVIENVAPGKSGEMEFEEVIRKLIC